MLSVINQAYYPLLLADATLKTCPLCSGDLATSAHSKPGLAYPLGIWGLGNYWTYSEGMEAIQPLLVHLRLRSCSLKLEEQNQGMLTCHLDFLV